MRKHLFMGAMAALAAPYMASAACPVGTTGANVLANVTRVVRFTGGIGVIKFLPNGFLTAQLTVNTTATGVLRHLPASGRWMFDGNCANGMIWVNSGRFRLQSNFVVVSATGSISQSTPPPIYGTLRPPATPVPTSGSIGDRIEFFGAPPEVCPPFTGGNPLKVFENTAWTYAVAGSTPEPAGAFVARLPHPMAGVLDIDRGLLAPNQIPAPPNDGTIRLNYMAFPRQELLQTSYRTQGRYTMESNCWGGELLFMLNGFSRQYEFLFTDDKLNVLIGISDLAGNTTTIGATFQGIVP